MKIIYKTILSALGAILFLSVLSLFSEKIYVHQSPLSVYNTDYLGYSKFYEMLGQEGYNIKIEADNFDNINYLGKGFLWVIISPANKYSEKEKKDIADFVSRGGTVLAADRFENGNEIAKIFGITVFNHVLVEYDSFQRRQDFPILEATLNGRGNYSLAYKFPSAIEEYPPETEIVSKSSRISFVDMDDNGKITIKDQRGPFPVAVKVKHDKGDTVFLSDPNVFSNDLIGRKDNLKFSRDLFASFAPSLVVFDESHANESSFTKNYELMVLAEKNLKGIKIFLAAAALIIILYLLWKMIVAPRKVKKETVLGEKPTEYSIVVKNILSNCGNNIYTRKWAVLTGYNKIKKNILAKNRIGDKKNITKEDLLKYSGLAGKEKDYLAEIIDLGMAIEKGSKIDINMNQMMDLLAKIEEVSALTK